MNSIKNIKYLISSKLQLLVNNIIQVVNFLFFYCFIRQIVADEDPVIALTTEIKIMLDGWHDEQFDADLWCNFYYTNMDGVEGTRKQINTVPVSLDVQGEKTTLPEGNDYI